MGLFSSLGHALGGALSGFVSGGPIGAIGGALAGVSSAHDADKTNSMLQNQWNSNYYLATNRHQIEVADLKAAGLNPILSANNGAVPQVASNAGQRLSPSERAMVNMSNAAQIGLMASQINKTNADARLAGEQADTQAYMRDEIVSRISLNKITEQGILSNISLNDARVKNLDADTQVKLHQSEILMKDLQYYDSRVAAELNLTIARAYQAYASGEASYAAATMYVANATAAYAQAGYLTQQTKNSIDEGAGIVIRNQLLNNDLQVSNATLPLRSSGAYQMGRDVLSDVGKVGLGIIGGVNAMRFWR